MTSQVFDIFQQECLWPFFFNHAAYIVEKCTLGLILKSRGSSQTVLFGYTGDRKWLARETGNQNVMIGYCRRIYFCDISMRKLTKVSEICLSAEFVPFTGIYALAFCVFKAQTHTSYPREQIDERVLIFISDSCVFQVEESRLVYKILNRLIITLRTLFEQFDFKWFKSNVDVKFLRFHAITRSNYIP